MHDLSREDELLKAIVDEGKVRAHLPSPPWLASHGVLVGSPPAIRSSFTTRFSSTRSRIYLHLLQLLGRSDPGRAAQPRSSSDSTRAQHPQSEGELPPSSSRFPSHELEREPNLTVSFSTTLLLSQLSESIRTTPLALKDALLQTSSLLVSAQEVALSRHELTDLVAALLGQLEEPLETFEPTAGGSTLLETAQLLLVALDESQVGEEYLEVLQSLLALRSVRAWLEGDK